MEASKQQLGVTVRTFSCGLQSQERHLADIQHQLEEAHRLEENMKRDLKRISKDIDVLQRQDLDVRNEISTQKKKFLHQRSVQVQTNVTILFRHLAIRCVQEKKVEESQEKLHTFVTDLRLKLEDRAKSPPAPGSLVAAPRCGHITECSCLLATALLQYVRRPQHRGRAGVPHLLRAGAAARAAVPRGPHPLQQLQAARGEVPGLQTRVQGDT